MDTLCDFDLGMCLKPALPANSRRAVPSICWSWCTVTTALLHVLEMPSAAHLAILLFVRLTAHCMHFTFLVQTALFPLVLDVCMSPHDDVFRSCSLKCCKPRAAKSAVKTMK